MATKPVTIFDKAACRVIGGAFHEMAKTFAAQYGLTVKPQGGRFDSNSFTPKVTFCIPTIDGASGKTVNKKDLEMFKKFAPMHGIDPEAFGKTITLVGKVYTIVGWNTKASKSPIGIQDEHGKTFKCQIESVRSQHPLVDKKVIQQSKVEELDAKERQKCCYCGMFADSGIIRMNQGACNKSGCVRRAMREEEPIYKNAFILGREKQLKLRKKMRELKKK
jgi:hypothetical protein